MRASKRWQRLPCTSSTHIECSWLLFGLVSHKRKRKIACTSRTSDRIRRYCIRGKRAMISRAFSALHFPSKIIFRIELVLATIWKWSFCSISWQLSCWRAIGYRYSVVKLGIFGSSWASVESSHPRSSIFSWCKGMSQERLATHISAGGMSNPMINSVARGKWYQLVSIWSALLIETDFTELRVIFESSTELLPHPCWIFLLERRMKHFGRLSIPYLYGFTEQNASSSSHKPRVGRHSNDHWRSIQNGVENCSISFAIAGLPIT